MSAAAPRELPSAAFLDIGGAQSPNTSGGEGEDSSDCSPRPGRGAEFRRLGLVAGAALAGVALLGAAAAGAAQALRSQDVSFAFDSEAALFSAHDRVSHRRRHHHVKHVAYDGPATVVQTTPEQPAYCNGTKLKKGRQGCCAGVVFDLMTTGCCGTMPFYFTSLSCCDHGDGTASLYEPYAQNCCDDPAVSNVQKGVCAMERGERSCCTRMRQGHRRRRRHRKVAGQAAHRFRAVQAAARVLGEDQTEQQEVEEAM